LNQFTNRVTAKQPPPPEAYAVLFGYHLFISTNHEQALQALNGLPDKLENSDPSAFQAVTAFKNEFLQTPGEQMQAPSPAELNGLHQLFPDDFPVKSLLLSISRLD